MSFEGLAAMRRGVSNPPRYLVLCLRSVNFPGPHGDTTRLVRNTSLCGNSPKHDAGHAG
jgi:hypothetical protein